MKLKGSLVRFTLKQYLVYEYEHFIPTRGLILYAHEHCLHDPIRLLNTNEAFSI